MANDGEGVNHLNDERRGERFLSKEEFNQFRLENNQSIRNLQQALDGILGRLDGLGNQGQNRGRGNLNRQQAYEENSDEEGWAENFEGAGRNRARDGQRGAQGGRGLGGNMGGLNNHDYGGNNYNNFHMANNYNPRQNYGADHDYNEGGNFGGRRRNWGGYQGLNDNYHYNEGGYNRRDNHEVRVKLELPTFDGQLEMEKVIDWLSEVERFFVEMEVPGEQQVLMVSRKLKSLASAWWENLQHGRVRQLKAKVRTWAKMKRLLQARFLPPDFEQILFQKYQNCRQGTRTVSAYIEEFYQLITRNDLVETEQQQVARFVGGLRYQIQDPVSLHTPHKLTAAVSLATKVEAQLNRSYSKAQSFNRGKPLASSSHSVVGGIKEISSNNDLDKAEGVANGNKKVASPNPYAKPMVDKCYRCGKSGHRSFSCPSRNTVNLVAIESEIEDEEIDKFNYNPNEVLNEEDGEPLEESLVIQRLMLTPKGDEITQRNKIFRTKCTINRKVCDLIIDGGSAEKIANKSIFPNWSLHAIVVLHQSPPLKTKLVLELSSSGGK